LKALVAGSEGATVNANTTTPRFSPPGTDLCMDWGDACSQGCLPDLIHYFLLAMDKDSEYNVSFPTKTRTSPLALLKQFVTFTGRKIRYLRIDGVKEFQSEEIKEYCADNDVVLQLVVTYNHIKRKKALFLQIHAKFSSIFDYLSPLPLAVYATALRTLFPFCPRPTSPRKFYALTISGMPLLVVHPCSPTRASTKTTVTRILPLISIDVIVVLSAT